MTATSSERKHTLHASPCKLFFSDEVKTLKEMTALDCTKLERQVIVALWLPALIVYLLWPTGCPRRIERNCLLIRLLYWDGSRQGNCPSLSTYFCSQFLKMLLLQTRGV